MVFSSTLEVPSIILEEKNNPKSLGVYSPELFTVGGKAEWLLANAAVPTPLHSNNVTRRLGAKLAQEVFELSNNLSRLPKIFYRQPLSSPAS